VLIAVADGYRTPLAVYTATLAGMFTTSALYHRGHWSAAGRRLWKRLDHSMIFLAIAGGYTAYCAIALPPSLAITILGIVWAGALAGVGLQLAGAAAPRWLSAPSYAALGLVAVFVLPDLLRRSRRASATTRSSMPARSSPPSATTPACGCCTPSPARPARNAPGPWLPARRVATCPPSGYVPAGALLRERSLFTTMTAAMTSSRAIPNRDAL